MNDNTLSVLAPLHIDVHAVVYHRHGKWHAKAGRYYVVEETEEAARRLLQERVRNGFIEWMRAQGSGEAA